MKPKKILYSFIFCCILVTFLSFSGSAAWKKTSEGTRYYTSKKTYIKSDWLTLKGKTYYFDEEGYRQDGRFQVGKSYYYGDKSNGIVKKKRVGDYYYGSKGTMLKNKWFKDSKGNSFYCGSNGKILFGQITVKGKTYFCKKKTGKVCGVWYKKHYYDKNGVMATSCWVNKSYVNKNGDITKGIKDPKNPSSKDVRLLACLVYYEAGNQSYFGKQCVASVVVNRMNSKTFPSTLRDVIFQSGQFTPAMNGSVDYLYYSGKSVQKECVNAAKSVLTEGTKLKGYYFFNACYGDRKIGDHYFSKNYY